MASQQTGGKVDMPDSLIHLEINDGNGRDETAVPGGREVTPTAAKDGLGALPLFGKALPHVFPYLLKPGVLALRRVSKALQQDIDKFLQNHRSLQPYDSKITTEISKHGLLTPGYFPGPFLKSFQGVCLTTLKQITAFLDQNADPTKNPFFERSVTLIQDLTDRQKNRAEYWNKIFILLTRFGSNIWSLSLNITPVTKFCKTDPNRFEYYNQLRKCLELVPNLKILRLYGSSPDKSKDRSKSAFKRDQPECCRYIQANPPPPLPNLQIIEINSQELSGPVRDGIIDFYKGQLKGLRVPLSYHSNEELLITELDLLYWPDDLIMKLPGRLPISAPNLKKLTIRQLSRKCIMDHFLYPATRFPSLDYLAISFARAATIENLKPLDKLVGITAYWKVDNPCAMFPNIKYLELKMDLPGVMVDAFIHCFPNLERLMIRMIPLKAMPIGYECLWGKEKRFNEALRTGRIYDRVIWEKIGSLKELVYVSEDPHEELEVGNYGQWKEEMDDWQWKPRADNVVTQFKRATREMIAEANEASAEPCDEENDNGRNEDISPFQFVNIPVPKIFFF